MSPLFAGIRLCEGYPCISSLLVWGLGTEGKPQHSPFPGLTAPKSPEFPSLGGQLDQVVVRQQRLPISLGEALFPGYFPPLSSQFWALVANSGTRKSSFPPLAILDDFGSL